MIFSRFQLKSWGRKMIFVIQYLKERTLCYIMITCFHISNIILIELDIMHRFIKFLFIIIATIIYLYMLLFFSLRLQTMLNMKILTM
jgi:hypothetical protein